MIRKNHLAAAIAILGLSGILSTSQAIRPAHQNEIYEIRLTEYDLHNYSTPVTAQASELATDSVAEVYGGRWHVYGWNAQTNTPSNLYGSGHETGMPMGSPLDIENAGRTVVTENASVLGVQDMTTLRFVDSTSGAGKVAAHFQQTHEGIDVIGGRVRATFTDSGRLFLMGSDYYGGVDVDTNPTLTTLDAERIARESIPYDSNTDRIEEGTHLAVLPVPQSPTSVAHHLVYIVRVHTQDPLGIWVTHVDAHTGEIVYRWNDVHFVDYVGSAQGDVEEGSYCNGVTADLPLGYMQVEIDGLGVVFADENGDWTVAYGGNDSRQLTAQLYGAYANVNWVNGADSEISATATPGVPFTIDFNSGNSRDDERDVYEAVNDVHDFFELFDPGWGRTNARMNANVDFTNGSCNAYYNGSINFYRESGGCSNTGLIQDVAYHEYGHGVQAALLGGGQGSQGLGEGNGDVLANLLVRDHLLGRGFFLNCDYGLRDSKNQLEYPGDVIGEEIHDAGRVIAGFHWDAFELFTQFMTEDEAILKTATDWHYGRKVDRPQTQPNQVLATFVADDDDGNLDNGTPNYDIYCEAAQNHGFNCPPITAGVLISHDEAWSTEDDGDFSIEATVFSTTGTIEEATVYYQVNEGLGYDSVPMANTGGDDYEATIPALQYPSSVDYYIYVRDSSGAERTVPGVAPGILHDFDVALIYDAFETPSGWTVDLEGEDTATAGIWERVDPDPTTIAPKDDTTPDPGQFAWVTGQSTGEFPGQGDIDGGRTSLYSPVYDLTGASGLVLKYWKWFRNDAGTNPNSDPWIVQVRNDGGAWLDIENTLDRTEGWEEFSTDLMAIVGTPGELQFKFIGVDDNPASFVDAGLDDFTILGTLDVTDVEVEATDSPKYALMQASPNPAREMATIGFQVPVSTDVKIRVFDVNGREVTTLLDGAIEAGAHDVQWNGTDDRGNDVASGVYYYQMHTSSYSATRSVILSR